MRRAMFCFGIALVVALRGATALADAKTDALTRSLREDSSFKVRAKAAELLAKRADLSAIPALVEALKKDDNEVVRASAAAALGVLAGPGGDAESLKALKAAASGDASSLVRAEAEKAAARFPAATTASSGGFLVSGVYLELGKFTNTSKVSDPALVSKFQSSLQEQLSSAGKPQSAPPKGKRGIKIDGAIQRVELKTGKTPTLTVALSVTVTREASILAIISKEGSLPYDEKPSPGEEQSGREEIVQALVEGAYQDIGKNLAKWK
jgi:DNA-binding NarL/FixJ family response regulator